MQKVYLLLRNNKQNGPYTLQELVQFPLQPHDLVWVDGASAGWYYPQEIKELVPYLSFATAMPVIASYQPVIAAAASAKKVFVAMPVTTAALLEDLPLVPAMVSQPAAPIVPQEDAKYLPQDAVNSTANNGYRYSSPQAGTATQTATPAYVAATEPAPAYTHAGYTKAPAANNRNKLTVAAFAFGAALMAFAAYKHFSPADELILPATAGTTTTPLLDSITAVNKQVTVPAGPSPVKGKKQAAVAKPSAGIKSSATNAASSPAADEKTAVINEAEETPPTVNEPTASVERPALPADAPNEKKTLKEKIAGIFKKKQAPAEEPKSVEVEDGERRTVRRQADATLTQQVRLKFTVPNDWMMGIKGATLSLTNKSTQTIAKAVVEVVYYNDDNEALQTKTVTFGKISSGDSGKVSIPDHAMATKVEYKIVSVQGSEKEA